MVVEIVLEKVVVVVLEIVLDNTSLPSLQHATPAGDTTELGLSQSHRRTYAHPPLLSLD